MVTVQPFRSKVAIVGTSPSWIEAPYNDSSWEIRGLNGGWGVMPRSDRWYEMHGPDAKIIEGLYGPAYVEWLGAYRGPVYMQERVEWVPTSVRYPIEIMTARFGDVWASTPAYMLAQAIAEGYQEIGIFGMDFTGQADYVQQCEWFQYLRGVARGMGIKVTFPESGCSIQGLGYRYGYDPEPALPGAVGEVAEREIALQTKVAEAALVELHQAEGGRLAYESALREHAAGTLTGEFLNGGAAHCEIKRDRAVRQHIEAGAAAMAARRIGRGIEHVARSGAA